MRLPQRQRMDFITSRLKDVGAINRVDLITAFEISPPQAANDFRTWSSLNPGQMVYNTSSKRYEKTAMTDTPAKPFPVARPQIIAKRDFVQLAELAYRHIHTRNLAGQMAEILGMSSTSGEKSCQRWLSDDGPAPPVDVLQDALMRATDRVKAANAMLERVDKVLKDID